MEYILPEFNSFSSVAPSSTANVAVPTGGPVYSAFYLEFIHGAIPAVATLAEFQAHVENVKIKLGSETIWDLSGTDLVNLNNYYGYPQVAGYVPMMFSRPEMLDYLDQRRFAIGTAGVRNFTVEVKLSAAVVAPQLRMFGNVLFNENRGPGQYIKVTSTAQGAVAGAGLQEIHDLPVVDPFGAEPYKGLKALHIKSGNITKHEIKFNKQTISEGPKALIDLVADHMAFSTVSRTPQANTYHVDFTGNRYGGILPMSGVQDFRLKLTFGAAEAAYDIIHEEIVGTPDL